MLVQREQDVNGNEGHRREKNAAERLTGSGPNKTRKLLNQHDEDRDAHAHRRDEEALRRVLRPRLVEHELPSPVAVNDVQRHVVSPRIVRSADGEDVHDHDACEPKHGQFVRSRSQHNGSAEYGGGEQDRAILLDCGDERDFPLFRDLHARASSLVHEPPQVVEPDALTTPPEKIGSRERARPRARPEVMQQRQPLHAVPPQEFAITLGKLQHGEEHPPPRFAAWSQRAILACGPNHDGLHHRARFALRWVCSEEDEDAVRAQRGFDVLLERADVEVQHR